MRLLTFVNYNICYSDIFALEKTSNPCYLSQIPPLSESLSIAVPIYEFIKNLLRIFYAYQEVN